MYREDDRLVVAMLHGHLSSLHPPLVRIQSACLYGDTLLASDCDCRHQLDESFRRFQEDGKGVLIYLNQEGRGAGLGPKAQGYVVQEQDGVDTVDAYRSLGLDADMRNYQAAILVLDDLGLKRIRLLTNNPQKIADVERAEIEVVKEPLPPVVTDANLAYLRTKQTKLKHDLGLSEIGRPVTTESPGPRCLVVGAAVIDHVFRLPTNPELGKARQAEKYERRAGGKALNQAIALARLEANASLVTVHGIDPDFEEIAIVLAREKVQSRFAKETSTARTPQTGVLQPKDGAPTYLGWLGRPDRTLRRRHIAMFAPEIAHSDLIVITLETSEEAIREVVAHVSPGTLVVLAAAPEAEPPYEIATRILENVDVVIGSGDELFALLSPGRQRGRKDTMESQARRLAELCGPTVIATDFRSPDRKAVGFNPHSGREVSALSADVRVTERAGEGVSTTVGNSDAFVAAFALSAVRLNDQSATLHRGFWRGGSSPFASIENALFDCLFQGLAAEAWVTSSRGGGYNSFPRAGSEFREWVSGHQPVLVPKPKKEEESPKSSP